MTTWQIYYENADTDDERTPLGINHASTMGEALQKGSEYWEYPSYDLVAKATKYQIGKNRQFRYLGQHTSPVQITAITANLDNLPIYHVRFGNGTEATAAEEELS